MATSMGVFVVTAAQADIVKSFEFDVDGELPSTDPDIMYCSGSGGLPESSAFSVSGGFLHQDLQSLDVGHSYMFGPDCTAQNGSVDPTKFFFMEARVQLSVATGNTAAYIQVGDGIYRYELLLSEGNGVQVNTATGPQFISVDVLQPHTYSIESPGSSSTMHVYVDGNLELTANAYSNSANFFAWGGGASGDNSTSNGDWDFVHFSNWSISIACGGDAYVRDYPAEMNYGSVPYLRVEWHWQQSWIYVKFDSLPPFEITKAAVYLYCNWTPLDDWLNTRNVAVYKTGHDWDEHQITWNNKPSAVGSALAATEIDWGGAGHKWYHWSSADLTSYVNEACVGPGNEVGFVFKMTEQDSTYMAIRHFRAREQGPWCGPVLVMDWDGGPPPEKPPPSNGSCSPGIPAVSEWGLVVMTLLVLTAGTLVYAHRRRVSRVAD